MAVKCNNCGSNALYTCADPGVNPVNYCGTCLPSWLKARADAGQFPLVERVDGFPPVGSIRVDTPTPKVEEEPEEEDK